jgi:hypothetical protein
MPQVCLLLVDKSQDVRELALHVLNSCMVVVKAHHGENKKSLSSSEDLTSPSSISISNSSSSSLQTMTANGQPNNSNGWASWAVDGFSKSIERVALNATVPQSTTQQESGSIDTPMTSPKPIVSQQRQTDEWGDSEIEFDDEGDSQSIQKPPKPLTTGPSMQTKPPKTKPGKSTNVPTPNEFDDWGESPTATSKTPSKSLKTKDKPPQPTITKMALTAHTDFDDWDDPPAPALVHVSTTQAKQTVKPSQNNATKFVDEFDEWGDDLGDLDISDLPPGATWGDEDDLDLDLNVLGGTSSTVLPSESQTTEKQKMTPSTSTRPLPTKVSTPAPTTTTPTPAAPKIKGNSVAKKEKEPSSSATKKPSKAAPVVKKLAVTADNWDDF